MRGTFASDTHMPTGCPPSEPQPGLSQPVRDLSTVQQSIDRIFVAAPSVGEQLTAHELTSSSTAPDNALLPDQGKERCMVSWARPLAAEALGTGFYMLLGLSACSAQVWLASAPGISIKRGLPLGSQLTKLACCLRAAASGGTAAAVSRPLPARSRSSPSVPSRARGSWPASGASPSRWPCMRRVPSQERISTLQSPRHSPFGSCDRQPSTGAQSEPRLVGRHPQSARLHEITAMQSMGVAARNFSERSFSHTFRLCKRRRTASSMASRRRAA